MGLAASQARFLAITSRKMNCEFQSMQIAQEKLSITRDLERVSQDYQNSLNATKLVWDTQDDDVYDLSYAIMMTPSALNEYDPYFITDSQGKILLTDKMFDAARDAGIIDAKGNPTGKTYRIGDNGQTDGSRDALLYQFGRRNQIDGSIADAIMELGPDGYTQSGIGGVVYDKTTADAMPTNMFINYMQTMTYGELASKQPDQKITIPEGCTERDKIYSLNLFSNSTSIKIDETTTFNFVTSTNSVSDKNPNNFVVTKGGQPISAETLKGLTVGDLLSGKYDISFSTATTEGNNDKKAKLLYSVLLNAIASALGKGDMGIKGLNVDVESDMALDQAYEFCSINNTITNGGSNTVSSLYGKAEEQNNIIKSTSGNIYSFSLSNMAKAFLTNFAISIEGFGCGYKVEKESAKKSNYVTDDPTYYFLLKKDSAMTDNTMLNADFYNMLYNQIATNGAIADSKMRELYTLDEKNLHNALKNGTLFISSLHNDGYFYQGAYTLSGHVAEVTDEEAIARAEIEYNVQKARLNNKEESLELKMKNLDMEISSLTTELDSVKNLISKNVEKVFTMFST